MTHYILGDDGHDLPSNQAGPPAPDSSAGQALIEAAQQAKAVKDAAAAAVAKAGGSSTLMWLAGAVGAYWLIYKMSGKKY